MENFTKKVLGNESVKLDTNTNRIFELDRDNLLFAVTYHAKVTFLVDKLLRQISSQYLCKKQRQYAVILLWKTKLIRQV